MKPLVRYAVCAALCLASASSMAGGAMESTSTRPDLFFAWFSSKDSDEPVVVNFARQADSRALTAHCGSGLPVYSFGQNARFTCEARPHEADSPEAWKAAEVIVRGAAPKSGAQRFGMFSLKPTRTTHWNTRAVTPEEQAALKAWIDANKPRPRLPAKQLKLAAATAVSASDERPTTLVVPGNEVRDEPGQYYAQRHYVFVKEDGAYAYRGMLPAKPTGYFDIDGGDLPAILVEEDCDGWCVSLWRISKGVRSVASFGGH